MFQLMRVGRSCKSSFINNKMPATNNFVLFINIIFVIFYIVIIIFCNCFRPRLVVLVPDKQEVPASIVITNTRYIFMKTSFIAKQIFSCVVCLSSRYRRRFNLYRFTFPIQYYKRVFNCCTFYEVVINTLL